MIMLIYVPISITFLVLVVCLLRKPRSVDQEDVLLESGSTRSFGNGSWLNLSERIFDPSDARWLSDELAFPKLAQALKLGRKRLAIRWLQALQSSFDALVRTPGLDSGGESEAMPAESWKLLWLTVRFKLLVSYALLVVRLFGPYHRLIPSFSWIPLSLGSERGFRRTALAVGRNAR